jgi:hypothetical protein
MPVKTSNFIHTVNLPKSKGKDLALAAPKHGSPSLIIARMVSAFMLIVQNSTHLQTGHAWYYASSSRLINCALCYAFLTILKLTKLLQSRDSSVSIRMGYGLDGQGSIPSRD